MVIIRKEGTIWVNCRIGSLEIPMGLGKTAVTVNCRIGSLEMVADAW